MGCSSSIPKDKEPFKARVRVPEEEEVAPQEEISEQKDQSRASIAEASEKSAQEDQPESVEERDQSRASVAEASERSDQEDQPQIVEQPSQQAKTTKAPTKKEEAVVKESPSKRDVQPSAGTKVKDQPILNEPIKQAKITITPPKEEAKIKESPSKRDVQPSVETRVKDQPVPTEPIKQTKTPIIPSKEEKTIVNFTTSKKDIQPSPETKVKDSATSQIDEDPSIAPKRMTRDTYEYLLEYGKNTSIGGNLPLSLARCFEGEVLLLIPGHGNWHEDYRVLSELVTDTFTRMCEATEKEEKTQWRTRMFNILEAIHQTHTGEEAFEAIRVAAGDLKANYPVTEKAEGEKVKVDIKDFDDVALKKLSLTSFFPFEQRDLVYNKEDYQFEFQHGEGLAILSERRAVKKVLQRAKGLKEEYYKTIGDLLTSNGGEHFKCGNKSYLRTEAKLNELAAEKKSRPVFMHLYDSLRCKAHFMDPKDLKKAYDVIASKFQILRLKNKLNTHLKNMTLNLIYKDIISEVQLVLGAPQAESENHILYEIERTRSIAELYEVVEGWGGFDFSTFEPLKGNVVEVYKPNMNEKWVTMGDTKYKILKSKEYGVDDTKYGANNITYFDESPYLNKPGEKLKIRYHENGIFVSVCSSFPAPRVPGLPDSLQPPVHTHLLKDKDDTIWKVEGFKDDWKIQGLSLHSRKGQVIKLGTIGTKVDFTFKAPDDAQIAGFGGKMYIPGHALTSLYCWIIADQEKIKFGYQGETQNGAQHEKGVMVYPDGSQYTGEWKNNKKNGKGVLTNTKGEIVYEGDWVDDMKHGKGRYSYGPQEWYNGNWKNDKREGMGQYSCADESSHYHGLWKNDKLNGAGVVVSSIGDCKGIWEDNYCKKGNLMETIKALKYTGGLLFDAEKKLLVPHGHGVFNGWTQVTGFGVGEWDHGKGKGKLLSTDEKGSKYEGELNMFDSTEKGTWHYLGGAKKEGSTHNETGGKYYHSDGSIIEGSVYDLTKWKFYAAGGSKATKLELNTKLLVDWSDESYYHAPTKTLYYGYDVIRFHGEKIDFRKGKGRGTWYLVNGEKVEGSWSVESDQFAFQGTIEYPSGNTFKGTFKANVGPLGKIELTKGTLTYKNGNKLDGTWEGSYFEKGTLFYSNGDKFVGSWRSSSLDEGKFHLSNGKQLELESGNISMYKTSNNKVIGFGSQGERFELDWDMKSDDDEKVVKGTCFYLNGDRYEGEIRVSYNIHGKGVLYYNNGDRFEGVWNHDEDQRKGRHFISKELVLDEEYVGVDLVALRNVADI